jgi:hypothetical protein
MYQKAELELVLKVMTPRVAVEERHAEYLRSEA